VQQTGSELESLNNLNTTSGFSGESFCKFMQQESIQQREDATYPFLIQQRRGETVKVQLSKGKGALLECMRVPRDVMSAEML
jgi:hypothetical protein